ncbi:MAG: MBL fold metallo-hydrolase [Clostridia bacterium]|nr:MBL fold metallo-hydrolase [Clostridia bacterium]
MSAEIYMLSSSSKGNACLIRNGADLFLIDAGLSAKRIREAVRGIGFDLSSLRCVLLTHEHSDHISGLEVLYHHLDAPLYAPSACFPELSRCAPSAVPHLETGDPGDVIILGDTRVYPIKTPHDALGSVGFRIALGSEDFAYFTDVGHLTETIVRAMSGCRRVVIESNYDPDLLENGPYTPQLKRRIAGPFGHLSNPECASLLPHLLRHGTERIMLAHLSEQNNTPEIARETAEAALGGAGDVLFISSPTETVSF